MTKQDLLENFPSFFVSGPSQGPLRFNFSRDALRALKLKVKVDIMEDIPLLSPHSSFVLRSMESGPFNIS